MESQRGAWNAPIVPRSARPDFWQIDSLRDSLKRGKSEPLHKYWVRWPEKGHIVSEELIAEELFPYPAGLAEKRAMRSCDQA
jgi:hypothetical protein